MQEAYSACLESPTRVLFLDKNRKAMVTNVSAKIKTQHRKSCLMLVVHPSVDPKDLWIKAGDGKQWSLRLLEGRAIPDVQVPAEVDFFSGRQLIPN